MIRSFRCSETRSLFETGRSRRFTAIARVAMRKLALLDAAESCGGTGSGVTAFASTISGAFAFDGQARDRKTSRSSTIIEAELAVNFRSGMRPMHPGEILREDYLVPLGLSANALAKALGVTAARVNDIVRERRGVTADTAIRLARYFGGDPKSWLNLQMAYDLRVAELASARRIAQQVKPRLDLP